MSTLFIEVNGIQYSNFEDASVNFALDAIAGSFNFQAVSTNGNLLPIKLGDECAIYADEQKVLTGYVEKVDVDYDSRSHSIGISGRSKTADIIDSMINAVEIKPPITLKSAIEKIVSHIGSDILVIDNVGTIEKFNSAEDLVSPEIGENAFEFIEKLARKRQVLLTSDGDGNIVITQAATDEAPTGLQNIIGNNLNNIKSASVSCDATERFGKYISKSQLNLTALNNTAGASSKEIVSQKSPDVIDKEIRSSRQLVLQAESSSSDLENKKRAQWEANIRKARSVLYSATVVDFSVNGKLWSVNQISSIKDEFAGVDARMLVNSISFSQNSNSSTATISFVSKDSYTLKLNEDLDGNILGDCYRGS